MKRLLLVLVGVAALVIASAVPASAHTPNPYANWACGATRENRDHVLDHAHPYILTTDIVVATCASHDIDTRCEWHASLDRQGVTARYFVRCRQIPAIAGVRRVTGGTRTRDLQGHILALPAI